MTCIRPIGLPILGRRMQLAPSAKETTAAFSVQSSLSMKLLGPLSKVSSKNQFVLVFTDRYTNIVRSIPVTKLRNTYPTSVFVDYWVILFAAPTNVLTGHWPQFVFTFLMAVCGYSWARHLTTTAFNFQPNGQVEKVNWTILARHCHCVAKHQTDWDRLFQPLKYGQNAQVHFRRERRGSVSFCLVNCGILRC